MNRRQFLLASGLALPALGLMKPMRGLAADSGPATQIAALEKQHGVRLGLAVLDTHTDRRIAHRADERFPLCSTFKLLLAAAVLARVDQGTEKLDRKLVVQQDDLLEWAPVTSKHVDRSGMSVAELCHAAITVSDNTAANLLLAALGGPQQVTRFARNLGDPVTRLDRNEPTLNDVVPGQVHDTTTPAAMLTNLQTLLLGKALSAKSTALLGSWLRACSTGRDQLRAGMPRDWDAGDKTGSNHRTSNDVAIFRPPHRKPLLVAAYCAGRPGKTDARKAVLRACGQIARSITKTRPTAG